MVAIDFSLDDLSQYATVTFPQGQVIFSDGDAANVAYIVESGVVQISKLNASGIGMVFGMLKKGSLFGEVALITEKKRSATATAMTDVVCRAISVADFNEMMGRIDPLTRKIILELIRSLSRLTNLCVLSIE